MNLKGNKKKTSNKGKHFEQQEVIAKAEAVKRDLKAST